MCGAAVKTGALTCPGCGACEKTGLLDDGSADAYTHDGLDLPADEFDYNAFVEKEFGASRKKSTQQVVIRVVTLFLIALIILVYLI